MSRSLRKGPIPHLVVTGRKVDRARLMVAEVDAILAEVEKRLRSHQQVERRSEKKSRAAESRQRATRLDRSTRDVAYQVLRRYRDDLALHDLAALVLFELTDFPGFKRNLARALRSDPRFERQGHGHYARSKTQNHRSV